MKILSLWQPHATLAIVGAKPWETRSWPLGKTPQRIGIHASKNPTDLLLLFTAARWYEALERAGFKHSGALPLGALIGTVLVVGCRPTGSFVPGELEGDAATFGDFSPDRFAWELKDPVGFDPIPMRGKQGLWEMPAEVLARIPECAR